MLYEVPDDKAEEVYRQDVWFFEEVIKGEFNKWGEDKDNPREPIDFQLFRGIGNIVKEDAGEGDTI